MRYLIILIIILSTYSCEKNSIKRDKKFAYSNVILLEKDTISFPINNYTNYFSWYTQVLKEGDNTYLCRLEYFKDEIEIYNFKTKKKEKSITLKTEGPNSVRDLQAGVFHFYTKDSFLFINRHSELFLMKNDSVLKRNIISMPDYRSTLFGDNARKMILSENTIFLRNVPYLETNSEEYLKGSILLKYNLLTHKGELCNISLHEKYAEPNYRNFDSNFKNAVYTYNHKTKRILISYMIFPEIYEYDIDQDQVINEYNAESIKVDNSSVPSKKNIPSEEVLYHYLTNGFYHEIIYDKYRDIYYRFISLPVPEYKKSMQKPYLQKPYEIMVLDNKFNIITEREFPQYRFNVKDWFITEDGLWLSNNNPNNPIFDEKKISFTLLKIEKNE